MNVFKTITADILEIFKSLYWFAYGVFSCRHLWCGHGDEITT